MGRTGLLVCLAVLLACGPAAERDSSANQDPAVVFGEVERRLLDAEELVLEYHVTAQGAVEVDIRGSLELVPRGPTRLTGTGRFAGQSVDLSLVSEDGQLHVANGDARESTVEPVHLREALVIGLTRMGVLHNLARLTAVAPPDHADGGVADWVTVGRFQAHPTAEAGAAFDLTVAGEPSGSAALALDEDGGLMERTQTVLFPEGEMHVVERYTRVIVTP